MRLAAVLVVATFCASVVAAKNDFLELDDDLACSATKTIADKIQKSYSAKFRKNKDADEEEKEEMARSAFVTACMADSYQQFAQMGPMGKRTYGDFNAMMSKGGNMDNLSMGPQVTEELVKSCKAIINTFGDEMAAGFAAAEKQFDYKVKRELQTMVGSCGKKAKGGGKKKKSTPPPPPPPKEEEEEVFLHDDDDL